MPRALRRGTACGGLLMAAERARHGRDAWVDLAIVVATTVAAAVASVHFELGELIAAWTRPREAYQLDELPGVLLVLAVGLAWFAWRRAAAARREVARRRAAEAGLAAALADNRRLERENTRVLEDERRHLARELHDGLGQYLNAIKVDATCLRDGVAPADTRLRESAASIVRVVDRLHGTLRDTLRRLRPPGLDELGIAAALEDCIDGWRRRMPGVRFELAIADGCDDLGEAVNMTLYRLVQEGLTNVAKHARATRASVRIDRLRVTGDASEMLRLAIVDDGVGVDPAPQGRGFGLIGMRERVDALRGTFEVAGAQPHGTRIVALLPLAAGAQAT
jgi:two-component system, NarL family, sensor histidine kinase UhpB